MVRSKFSASRWVDHLRENQVTVTNFLGVMMDFVWKQPRRPDDADNVLRCVSLRPRLRPSSTSSASGSASRRSSRSSARPRPVRRSSRRTASSARPGRPGLLAATGSTCSLVDPDTDDEVPVGAVGEFVVRPKHPWTCSLGYYNMPEKTAEAAAQHVVPHRRRAAPRRAGLVLLRRPATRTRIRRRGENISSYEVEQVVLAHPAVVECAVIGVRPTSMPARTR